MRSFAGLLAQHLTERGLSGAAFAQRVGYNQSYLSKILRGIKPPPLGMVETWATALELSAPEQQRLALAAALDMVPAALHPSLIALALSARLQLHDGNANEAGIVRDLLLDDDDALALAMVRGKGRRRRRHPEPR